VPKNRSNPFYRQPTWNNPEGLNFIDFGLAATTLDPLDKGKMKVPTLRNVTLTAPYFHNGVFNTLEEVVRFYSDRDKGGFDSPEVAQNVNRDELGNLGLSTEDVADLVAFLNTLTDGYEVE
jgi:cytochrome c peroxidase